MNARGLIVSMAPLMLLGAVQPILSLQPGEWETVTAVTSSDLPGVPAFVSRLMMKPKTNRRCIDARTAAQGPAQAMLAKGCTAADLRMASDSFVVDLVCGKLRTHIYGRATADTLDGTGETTKIDSKLDVWARFTSRRIGICS